MGQPDRGVGGVDRLAARAAGAVDVDADVLVGDVDLVGLLEHRHHLDRGERRLPAALVVERADPHQPVGAGLDRERAVGVRRVDGERRRLEAGLLGVGGVEDLDRVVVLLGPAGVHPHQHLGEVRRVDPTGAGADRHERLARRRTHRRAGCGPRAPRRSSGPWPARPRRRPGSRCVALLAAELDHDLEVLEPAGQRGDAVDLALEGREASGHAGGVVLVVPEVGRGDLLAEVGDLGAHGVEVEHLLDGVHGRLELLDLGVEVGSCHKGQDYGLVPGVSSCGRTPARRTRRRRCPCGRRCPSAGSRG